MARSPSNTGSAYVSDGFEGVAENSTDDGDEMVVKEDGVSSIFDHRREVIGITEGENRSAAQWPGTVDSTCNKTRTMSMTKWGKIEHEFYLSVLRGINIFQLRRFGSHDIERRSFG